MKIFNKIKEIYKCMKKIRIYKKITSYFKKTEIKLPFTALTPTSDAKDCDIYLEALDWALKNKKTIKNIAISGTYGSGKSSIIETFKAKQSCYWQKNKCFNISLATFKDPKTLNQETDNENNNPDKTLQRLIEMSILQQIIAHEKDYKLPESRLKKIKSHNKFIMFGISILIFFFIIAILLKFFPNLYTQKNITFLYNLISKEKLQIITSVFLIVGSITTIYKILQGITQFSTIKFNFHNTEIEVKNETDKSILNHHLEEIIYFFQQTSYEVVIIEDVDRFEQTEIFIKLREINLLLNNSKKINRPIIFIYAIKDDMFLDTERTKFFDFMIPVIPVINFSNSGDKLREICKASDLKINDNLIDDLCIFIEDMRFLYNIVNELYIYNKKLSKDLDINKLFAIIIYKNIYPKDFNLLNKNTGILCDIINQRRTFIRKELKNIDIKIYNLKKEIALAQIQTANNIKELRSIYISKLIEKISQKYSDGFYCFNIENNKISISEITSDELFDTIKTPEDERIRYYYNGSYSRFFSYKFTDIEKEVNKNISYDEREKIILDKENINNLKDEIKKLNNKKDEIAKFKLKDITQNNIIDISKYINEKYSNNTEENYANNKNIIIPDKQIYLINNLIKNGYIDENYLDYISIFHEGSLTHSDYQFLMKIKNNQKPDFDYKLYNKKELLKKIDKFSFSNKNILNFDLFETLLEIEEFQDKKELVFKQLTNKSKESYDFIDKFIDITNNIEDFIYDLCKDWNDIWKSIEKQYKFEDDKKEKYFKLIIKYAATYDINNIFYDSTEYINNFSDFLNINRDEEDLKDIIAALELKFTHIDMNSPQNLLNFIFENNHYEINFEMINNYIFLNPYMNDFKNLSDSMNYTLILKSKTDNLINYIQENIEQYVKNVLLKLENNTKEIKYYYLSLLNNKDLSIELKNKVIKKIETKIEDLKEVNDIETQNILLKNNKIEPLWENILLIFNNNEEKLTDDTINYLNNRNNAEELSKIRIITDKDENDKQIYSELCRCIVNNSKLTFDTYKLLVKSVPWCWSSFETENLTQEKIRALIENGNICRDSEAFNYLSENFKDLNILLLEKYFYKFENIIKELTIDSADLEKILSSEKIQDIQKINIINKLGENLILENIECIKILAKILIENEELEVNNKLEIELIKNMNLDDKLKIKLFNYSKLFNDKDEITEFLNSLEDIRYNNITNFHKHTKIENTPINQSLLQKLKDIDYISSFSIRKEKLIVNHKKI